MLRSANVGTGSERQKGTASLAPLAPGAERVLAQKSGVIRNSSKSACASTPRTPAIPQE